MTTTADLWKVAALGIVLLFVLTAASSGSYQQTQGLLIDDNETANATFTSGSAVTIGGEVVYDGSTVCVGNTDCGDVESSESRAKPDRFESP